MTDRKIKSARSDAHSPTNLAAQSADRRTNYRNVVCNPQPTILNPRQQIKRKNCLSTHSIQHSIRNSVHKPTAFFISDSTGITAETIGNSLIAQFPHLNFNTQTFAYVDSEEKCEKIIQKMKAISLF